MPGTLCLYSPDDAVLRRLTAAWAAGAEPRDRAVRTVRTLPEMCAALAAGAEAALCHAPLDALVPLCEAARGAPILLLLAHPDEATIDRALTLGATDVLDLQEIDGPGLERALRHGLARTRRQSEPVAAPMHGGLENDFNNLLEVILGCTGLARDSLDPQHPAHEDLACVQQAARKAAGLVRQLQTMARRPMDEPRPVRVGTLVTGLRGLLQRTVGPGITLEIRGVALGTVRADPTHVEQLLLHLAANARDAMPHGGTLTIEVVDAQVDAALAAWRSGLREGPYVMLRVSDDGPGLDEAVKARLFEPFFSTRSAGAGLGLATCSAIVRQGGGVILVDSAPGCGATFSIYLPRIDVA
jgi:signal transduction histidine kinase